MIDREIHRTTREKKSLSQTKGISKLTENGILQGEARLKFIEGGPQGNSQTQEFYGGILTKVKSIKSHFPWQTVH